MRATEWHPNQCPGSWVEEANPLSEGIGTRSRPGMSRRWGELNLMLARAVTVGIQVYSAYLSFSHIVFVFDVYGVQRSQNVARERVQKAEL